MKKSRFCVAILLGSVILFLHSLELDAISIEDTKRIKHATQAVESLAKAMKALKFIEWVSKVGSALGPAMMAVSVVLDIVFSFLGLESAEMKYMKVEFKNLNDRLDSFTERFQEVKNKIDWSSVQMSFGKVEINIRALAAHRRRITEAKTAAETEEAGKSFVNKYELDYNGDSDLLYNAMISGSSLSDNIFEASAVYTYQNPELTGAFMRGCIQLLMESYQIQGTFIHLKYNNSELDEYYGKTSSEKLNKVMSKAKAVYEKMQGMYQQQSMKDLKRMASLHMKLSHNDFAEKFYSYISSKYIQRRWFVAAYNPVKTYDEHHIYKSADIAISDFAGRNLVLANLPMTPRQSWSIAKAKRTLDFKQYSRSSNGALGIWLEVDFRNKREGYPVQSCAVVRNDESLKYRCNEGHCVFAKKSMRMCPDPACWGAYVYTYDVVVFG